jgi:hypothetical protein
MEWTTCKIFCAFMTGRRLFQTFHNFLLVVGEELGRDRRHRGLAGVCAD